MTAAAFMPEAASEPQATILCVDDEANILSSLRRVFRAKGYRMLTAGSGREGLEILESEPVDLVISDMRMPEMDGARFLEYVRDRWPDTIRLLLTGHADIQSILDAINRGEIYRYVTKPWDDSDITLVVRHALERKALEQEKKRLEALTRHQNEALRTLNAQLEAKVEERTAALKIANQTLQTFNDKLKISFLTSIKVFSNLIEMRGGDLAGHSRRVAALARKTAVRLGLDARETQGIFVAGLLHNIGKVGFSDDLLTMPVNLMNGENPGQYRKYPVRGGQLLMPLEDLRGAARIIRSQQERFDGEGYPDQLSGFNIPIGARILALAGDYENLQNGTLFQRRLRTNEVWDFTMQGRGKRYDPAVVTAFSEAISGISVVEAAPQEEVAAAELRPGMTIARELITRDGFLLLSADHVLDERLIQQIVDFEVSAGARLSIWIHSERRT
jgi:response regulator RpfG family c-di-GMP phosphodiesterase